MLFIAVAFFLGNTWVQCVPMLNAAWLLVPVVCTVVLILLVRRRLAFYLSVAFVLGIVWASGHAWMQLADDLRPELEGRDIEVTGVVSSIPQHESYGLRFELLTEQAQVRVPTTVQINWYSNDVQVHAGERWQLLLRMKRRHGYGNPGSFDYEEQLFREGIGATGYVRDSSANQLLGVASGNLVLRTRAALAEKITAAIPDSAMQGVVRGLAVGDQQAISGEQWQVFSRTGISHLIAISGSHIGMVAFLFAWLGGLLVHVPGAQQWKITKPDMQALVGFPAAVGYSLLAGMSVPTQRTLIMIALYFATRVLRREVNVWHSFGLGLLLVTLIDPFAPLAIGTWLSFGAVAVILINQQGRIAKAAWWREFVTLQSVVTLGLLPLLISAFGNVSVIAPWINLLAIPVFTFVLVPAVLIGCVLLVSYMPLGVWWLQQLVQLMSGLYGGLQYAAQQPLAIWYVPQSPAWAMCLLGIGVVWMILPWLWPQRMCGLVCCLPALLWQPERLPTNAFELTVLDVGQGLALVVRTSSHVLVYDTGPKFQSGTDTGTLVVLPYLHSLGIRNIDAVMISHGDDDHAGGMQSVARGMPVQQWFLGPSVSTAPLPAQTSVQTCQLGQHWQWDEVQFDVLYPRDDADQTQRNNTSCILRISAAGGSALLMGDAEAPVEQQLVSTNAIRASSIVVAGHHGSRTSSTAEFVETVQAQDVIFSAGYRNRWGFPKPEVVAAWQLSGAHTHSTIDAGAISIQVLSGGVQAPKRYREPQRHYWQLK